MYHGHSKAVKSLNFSNDGLNFLSGGYDKLVHYWDAETGKPVSSFFIKHNLFCSVLNPDPA